MFAQTLWSIKVNMHHNLAQKLCQVLRKLCQLLENFVPQTPYQGFTPGPHWRTSVSQTPCMCHLHVLSLFWTTSPPNKFRRRPCLHACFLIQNIHILLNFASNIVILILSQPGFLKVCFSPCSQYHNIVNDSFSALVSFTSFWNNQ